MYIWGFPGGLVVKNPSANAWVQSLIWKDPTSHWGTKPMRHSYWACALEPGAATTESHLP